MSDTRILALDYGDKRVGVAVSDPLGFFAVGHDTITYKNSKELWGGLEKMLHTYTISKLVLGLPRHMNGDEGLQAEKTRAFAGEWGKRYPAIPVAFWDERLTTVLAHQTMHALGKKPSRDKAMVDQVAAVRLLQDFLDSGR